jgi:quercetin dioxygenase-like cupin family protein
MNSKFFSPDGLKWASIDAGVRRKILGFDEKMMMVLVDFKKNAVGRSHSHPHAQSTYILSGLFEVTIDLETRILKEGDCFIIPGNSRHGVLCLEDGLLLDVFSPAREDFLKPAG